MCDISTTGWELFEQDVVKKANGFEDKYDD